MMLPWAKSKVLSQGKRNAVAYYRHSAQDRQENSIEIQQDQVRKFAAEHSITIIREFADRGKTGLCVEGRDAFNEMLHDYVERGKADFEYVLVLDVSRWGRFQEADLSAYYTGLCIHHGKQVIYTTIGFPKPDDLFHGVHLSIERYRAASYSRELSGKVWKGSAKVASDGYWASGPAPYGMRRLLLDENDNAIGVLGHGEHKAIQNQRVILTPSNDDTTVTVRNIFDWFANQGMTAKGIARRLNREGIPSPHNSTWHQTTVMNIMTNSVYAGELVWNRKSGKMKSPRHRNPSNEWIKISDAFEAIISKELFGTAQQILRRKSDEERRRRSAEDMLAKLLLLYQQQGTINDRLISKVPDMLDPQTYRSRFHSTDAAFQLLFQKIIEKKRSEIVNMLKTEGIALECVEDFFVVDGYFSLTIQPSVPVPRGYEVYWSFQPDQRGAVDLTIGVPLSCPDKCEIIGYLAFPRMLFRNKVRIVTGGFIDPSLWAYHLVSLIKQLRS